MSTMAFATRISVNMITRNGLAHPRDAIRALRSCLPFTSEFIVADTGSDPATLLRLNGWLRVSGVPYRLVRRVWRDDFAWARNEVLALSSGEMVFWIDDDDELPQNSATILRRIAERRPERQAVLAMTKGPGIVANAVTCRLFPRLPGIEWEGRLHEQVRYSLERLDVPAVEMGLCVWHHGYADEAHLKESYARLEQYDPTGERRKVHGYPLTAAPVVFAGAEVQESEGTLHHA